MPHDDQESGDSVDDVNLVNDLGYSQGMISVVCTFCFMLNVINNLDHGGLPAALSEIQRSLQIKDGEMGGMGSLVFFGLVIGSVCATQMFYYV